MKYSGVIVAAGNSSRFESNKSKMLYQFSNGETVIDKTLTIFFEDEDCKEIIVVVNKEVNDYLLHKYPKEKLIICEGGNSRQESVYNGLKVVKYEYVLIHDGARCFLQKENLENLKKVVQANNAAILGKSVTDTIKIVENGSITATLDRQIIKRAQTPQGFKRELLLNAYEKANEKHENFTDDSQLVEKYSDVDVKFVEAIGENIKITTLKDVEGA